MSAVDLTASNTEVPRLIHPGPAPAARVVAVPTRLTAHEVELPEGAPLLEALADLLESTGSRAAVGELVGGTLAEMAYYIPDIGAPGGPVADFSAPRAGLVPVALERGGLTVGHRGGSVFCHSHALFTGADGRRRAGHLIPESVVLGARVTARVWTAADVTVEVQPDPETGMSLFVPRLVTDTGAGEVAAVMCRVRPNVDLVGAVESLADAQGWEAAHVRGQIGSLVGGRLRQPDGRVVRVDGPATEVMYLDGAVRRVGGRMTADLHAAMVDRHAEVYEGGLVAGQSPVAMTYELVLTEASG